MYSTNNRVSKISEEIFMVTSVIVKHHCEILKFRDVPGIFRGLADTSGLFTACNIGNSFTAATSANSTTEKWSEKKR